MTTTKKKQEQEQAIHEKKQIEQQIKTLDGKIQNVKSDIDKNNDQLLEYEEHKKFLLSIFKKDNPKWYEEQEKIREMKLRKEKELWVKYAHLNRDQVAHEDHLIKKMLNNADSTMVGNKRSNANIKGKQKQDRMPTLNDQELEAKFNDLLAQDLIDVSEDFYKMDILYSDPYELMDNFSYLED